ncbi:MAG: hypothetical protein GX306_01180 [Clostridiales bacterium]|jgi:CarD family transcriptional regulator|nr:hypothetical protein [Clostridiales bacterium]
MFKQGDHIMYSYHGVCYIDEIREDIIEKEKKLFYIMHPFNEKSRIMTPVDNDKVKMRAIMSSEEAREVLNSVSVDNALRIPDRKKRDQVYTKLLKEGDPKQIIQIINALNIEDQEKKAAGKNMSTTDKRILERAEKLLYPELSLALGVEVETIKQKVETIFQEAI